MPLVIVHDEKLSSDLRIHWALVLAFNFNFVFDEILARILIWLLRISSMITYAKLNNKYLLYIFLSAKLFTCGVAASVDWNISMVSIDVDKIYDIKVG